MLSVSKTTHGTDSKLYNAQIGQGEKTMSNGVVNIFTNNSVSETKNTSLTQIESQRAIQEVQAAMIIAKKFPRDPIQAMDRILNACTRQTLAEGALYSYPRGGMDVTGPSIRLAEAIAQEWGNLQFGIRELEQNDNESTVEAFAWDIERNTRQVKTFTVPHVRFTKKSGRTKLTDPRDIYEMIANQGARRLRACILGVIPGDVVEAAQKQCEVTLAANVEITPETIKNLSDAFNNEFQVTIEQLQERLQCKLEALRPAQYLQLKKIYVSLRDGMSKVSDWFVVVESQNNSVKQLNEEIA